jgi:hypothetical protein
LLTKTTLFILSILLMIELIDIDVLVDLLIELSQPHLLQTHSVPWILDLRIPSVEPCIIVNTGEGLEVALFVEAGRVRNSSFVTD